MDGGRGDCGGSDRTGGAGVGATSKSIAVNVEREWSVS